MLARTALCGALAGASALLATVPAAAQTTPRTPLPPAMPVFSGQTQSSGGGAPTVLISGGTLKVDLHAPRTVIDWSSFNLAGGNTATFNFGGRNWIVLNRVNDTGPDNISGSVAGLVNGAFGGNIWFYAKNGLVFGSGATVDAGGLLVTASAPNLSQFLDTSNFSFDFTGPSLDGGGTIKIESGATLSGHGGLAALIAENITSDVGSAVNGVGGSSVLYGVADAYTIRFTQTAQGDLDLVDFIVPGSDAGSPDSIGLDLQNSTTASSVFVAAVSRTAVASAVINLEGMITAQSATAQGGDIILSGGGGIVGRAAGPALEGGKATDVYLNKLSASRDIQLANIGLTLAKPWPRPPKVVQNPPVIPPPDNGCTNSDCGIIIIGNGNGGCVPTANLGCSPVDLGGPRILLGSVDDSFISTLSAGRDVKLIATQEIDLGAVTAGRDLRIDGDTLFANSLTAARTTTIATEGGLLHVGQLTLGGDGSVASHAAAQVDSVSFTTGAAQTLTVSAANDATLGDGSGDVGGGVINLVAGGNAFINVGGSAKVTSVVAQGSAILQAGALDVTSVKAQQVIAKGGSVKVGQATSAGDVYIVSTSGDATANNVTAGDDVYVQAGGGTATLVNATLTGQGPDTVGAVIAGNADKAGNGRVVSVISDLDATLGLGNGVVTGASGAEVKAGQDAFVSFAAQLPGALSVTAGRDATLQAATVSFSAVTAGRDLTLTATAGDLTSAQNINAIRNITLNASGALGVKDINAANGSITLTGKTVSAGALSAGQDLTLKAGGSVQIASYKVGRDLIVQATSLNLGQALSGIGRDLSITTPGDFTAAGDLAAGRNVSLVIGGSANLKNVTGQQTVTLDVQGKAQAGAISGADVHIVAADLDVSGAITAATLEVESRTGALRLGGSSADGAPASGLWVDNAEFGRIHASKSASFYAGPVAGAARGDLTVLNLDVDPVAVPLINLLAGGGHNVLVQGVAAPTAPGGAIRIGDAANSAWQPTSILISGGLGAATFSGGVYSNIRDFNDVRLHATQDIIMGSPRFIGLIQTTAMADIELGRNHPSGVQPTAGEQNKVFISAGRLELSAPGKVVSQDTSPSIAQSVGIFLTAKASPDLVIDPPQLVDIFGTYLDGQGKAVASFAAGGGVDFAVVDSQGNKITIPTGAVYRFNSCAVGTSQCSGATQLTSTLAQSGPVTPAAGSQSSALGGDLGGPASDDSGQQSSSSGGSGKSGGKGTPGRTTPPPLLAVSPTDPSAALSDPVTTGAGSEEIWRSREAKP